jgi:molecular chaperone DnaJ
VLRDSEKRQIYDLHGHEGLAGTGFRGFGGREDIFGAFSGLFEDFFGFGAGSRGRPRSGGPVPGADLRYDLAVSFEDAARGTQTQVEIPRLETCRSCRGTGQAEGSKLVTCPTCGGRGQVIRSEGFFRVTSVCQHCGGRGVLITIPCRTCGGEGRVRERCKVAVRIPGGVDTGSRLRLKGEGESGMRGGGPGDLYIVIHVEAHEFFERRGKDVYCQLPISFAQAVLGDEVEVPTLDGPRRVSVPAGTQTGTQFRLKGAGFPDLRGFQAGDQVVEVVLVTPTRLTERQEVLISEFEAIEKEKSERGFFRKLFRRASAGE